MVFQESVNIMKASTRHLARIHGWRIDRFVHNYLYFVFYHPYVRIAMVLVNLTRHLAWFKPLGFIGRMAFDRYHSKVLSAGDTRKIFRLEENIHLVSSTNKQVVPFRYATRIIFQEPRYIAVMDCPCKAATGSCEPIACCIAVGRQVAGFWLDHCQKYHARRISQQKALSIVRHYRKKGHITQAFFKVATGGSTGVICNCCPHCCVSLKATAAAHGLDPGLTMNAPAGYRVVHDPGRCSGCGQCAAVCYFQAAIMKNGKRHYTADRCMGCELCVEHCPDHALALIIDPDKPLPLDLERIREMTP
jgi:Pyruvate/2-oxoacid:ferredoxin oxidoreductase delta subunit